MVKEKMGRNSGETESRKNMIGHRVESAGNHNQPGCVCAGPGEPHRPLGWSWEQSQWLGDMGSAFTFPLELGVYFSRVWMCLLTNSEK